MSTGVTSIKFRIMAHFGEDGEKGDWGHHRGCIGWPAVLISQHGDGYDGVHNMITLNVCMPITRLEGFLWCVS